ncbi:MULTISPECIES: metallophosphoesterase [Thalassolituus]|uniref:metallophosphoesterase n=2 Tax=Oceanospirillaceae TaxID=135620 RepID=UPI000C3D453A|nr:MULTISPECIES: metallophosphoesterase [Thalassolituus]MAX86763.1 serine/threonine protein phosphatase [Oceanospirillaceae bacterium]|tara:strand:+ start:16123 stop:17079 length:957 start_codon:yes stop_codon:yes gene_type:complete
MHQGYDLIGDIHGCGLTLIDLLEQMGYSKRNGVYQHPKRKVVFLGDIVDRGPNIRLACHIVRDMVEAGHADIVMGNHEYNVVTYLSEAPAGMRQPFLRPHTPRNNFIVEQTLEQFANYPQEFNEMLDWFLTIPLFREYEHFRVVHACWDHQMIDEYLRRYGSNHITKDMLPESVQTDSFLYQFLDRMLRGTSLKLPDGRSMTAKDGMVRQFFRTKFWAGDPQRYNDVIFQPDPLPEDLQHALLSEDEKEQLLFYGPDEKPLFIGHYWMSGLPEPIVPNIACLDYSAVKYGRLVAYRMDTERHLQKGKFAWVRVEKKER